MKLKNQHNKVYCTGQWTWISPTAVLGRTALMHSDKACTVPWERPRNHKHYDSHVRTLVRVSLWRFLTHAIIFIFCISEWKRFIVSQWKHDGKQSPLQICCAQFQHVFNLHELKLGGVCTKGQNNNTAIANSLSSLKEAAALIGHHRRDSNITFVRWCATQVCSLQKHGICC